MPSRDRSRSSILRAPFDAASTFDDHPELTMRLVTPFRVAFVVWLIVTIRMTFELTDAEMTRAFIVTQVQLVAALLLVPIILRRRSHADESRTDGSAPSKPPAGSTESAKE